MGKDTGFFNEIKHEVSLEDYLQDVLNVELISDGAGRLKGCCPFHSEASPSFKVMTDEDPQRWWCFGACSTGGSVIDAVIMANGGEGVMSAVEAAMWLNDYYDLGKEVNSEEWQRFRANVEETRETIKEAQENLESESREAKVARAYLDKRGFTAETIANFRLGVDTSMTKSGRVSIPLVDKANHEISVDGRSLFDGAACRTCQKWVTAKEMNSRRDKAKSAEKTGRELPFKDWRDCPHCEADNTAAGLAWVAGQHPKYRFKGGYEKSRHLYNHFGAKRALVEDAKLMREESDQKLHGIYVCEGYADVWSCWQAGQHAVCAYNGSQMSDVQAADLVELAHQFGRPIILVPDFDKAGRNNVENNVAKLRAIDEKIEIHVLTGVDQFEFTDPNTQERKQCKDVGDVLQHHGTAAVLELLDRNRRPVEDWLIRMVLDARSERTGVPFYTKDQQLTRVAEILRQVHHRHSLDYLVPVLADAWKMGEDQARSFFYSALSDDELTSMSHLIGTIEEAQADALDFILNSRLIPTGYARIDKAIGGGARRGWLCMMLGKSGTGKTMWCLQTLANMAAHGTRSIFFSLEQKKGQLFERMTQQVLGVDGDQARLLIKENHESLAEVRELFKNLRIVDNVPTATQEAVEMTAGRVQSIIRETNMMHFEGAPCDVVVIDHLGILKVGKDAPRAIQSDPLQAAGYIMEQMFAVCKAANVFMIVLQQLPKEIKAGVEIEFDAGRGGSAQTDFCDIILTAWRPELEAGIDDAERLNRKGQYKLKASKNRYGPAVTEHMMFDNRCLRIVPTDAIAMPTDDISDTPRVQIEGLDLDDAPQVELEPTATATATAVLEAPVETADLKETAEMLGLVEDTDGGSEAADVFDDWLRD